MLEYSTSTVLHHPLLSFCQTREFAACAAILWSMPELVHQIKRFVILLISEKHNNMTECPFRSAIEFIVLWAQINGPWARRLEFPLRKLAFSFFLFSSLKADFLVCFWLSSGGEIFGLLPLAVSVCPSLYEETVIYRRLKGACPTLIYPYIPSVETRITPILRPEGENINMAGWYNTIPITKNCLKDNSYDMSGGRVPWAPKVEVAMQKCLTLT